MTEATFSHRLAGQFNALALPGMLGLLNTRLLHFDRSTDPARPEYDQHRLFLFWHEYILLILPRWGHTPLTALCSQHRDGEWVNQTASSLGLHVIRGSSSRGGAKAIRQIRRSLAYSSVAVTPDGPRGPRRQLGTGSIFMASRLGVSLVPVGVGISDPIRLRTWDRFVIPKPWSRVRIVLGPPLELPRRVDREGLESYRKSVQSLMDDLTEWAQDWADSGRHVAGQQPFVRCRRTNRMPLPTNQDAKRGRPQLKTRYWDAA